MTDAIIKFFKFLGFILLLALLCLAILAGVWWMEWPLWIGAFIIIGLLGIYLFIRLCARIYTNRRDIRFAFTMSGAQGMADSSDDKELSNTKAMQVKWKQAVDALRKSHLKTMGNPLYVLPWYMITGDSASGKTTAIRSARLSSPFDEANAVKGVSGTKNCDWWFFDKAIIIDTAGRYSIHQNNESDRGEWQRFLYQMAKYRKKEPLNGLIITVTADRLLEKKLDDLSIYGKSMRGRIDELMRALGSKFPVYVLVTKCDHILGMVQLCDQLPESSLSQTMGMINNDLAFDPVSLVNTSIKTIGNQLRDLILLVLHKPGNGTIEPELFLLPDEFEHLKPGFTAFVQALMKENPYQETPIFRGIFFSSGRQEGNPFDHFLEKLGAFRDTTKSITEDAKGLFLHDFFSKLLPSDRGLFQITKRAVEWRKLTRNLWFATWAAVLISVCGLLSFSFVKNLQVLKEVSLEFKGSQLMQDELLADITTLERFSQTIVAVEERNSNWWFPRLGLTESVGLEAKLKEKYCSLMKKRFLDPFDKQMEDKLAYFSLATPTEDTINHVTHLVRRINLIKARLAREDLETLMERSQPFYASIETGAGQNLIHEIRQKLKHMVLYYLYWKEDTHGIEKKKIELQRWLKRILSISGANLNWLVTWANLEPDLMAYTLSDFWGFPAGARIDDSVAPAFTLAGKAKIDAFIGEIETALTDPLLIAGLKRDFQGWYDNNVIKSWHHFLKQFPKGESELKTKEDWKTLVDRVHLEKSPYFMLLDVLDKELDRFGEKEDLPLWIIRLFDFKEIQAQAALVKTQQAADSGIVKRAASRVTSRLRRVGRIANQLKRYADTDDLLEAGKALFTYLKALNEMIPTAASEKTAFKAASIIYSEDQETSSDPFFKAKKALKSIKQASGVPQDDVPEFWTIISGPVRIYHDYILRLASCRLQQLWESEVLMELKDIADRKSTNSLLFGREGYASTFIKGTAEPFIGRSLRKGFYTRSVDGKGVTFTDEFLYFMSKGIVTAKPVKDSYKLEIQAFPTDVNENALIEPHATIIEIQCGKETTLLENFNYPVHKTMEWLPNEPCIVVFKIMIEGISLTKTFDAPNALPKFLKMFHNGQRKFLPKEFPEHEDALKRRNISYIRVKYHFDGHAPLLELLRATPGSVPQEIVTCWD